MTEATAPLVTPPSVDEAGVPPGDVNVYREIVEMFGDLVCRYLPDTTLTFVNNAYCRYFGRSREDLIGRRFLELLPAGAKVAAARHVASILAEPRDDVYAHPVVRPDGSTGWQEWVDRPIYDARGTVVELQAVGRDVTARHEAEQALKASESRYRALTEMTSDFVYEAETTPDGQRRVNWASDAITGLIGYSRVELGAMGGSFASLVIEDDQAVYLQHHSRLARGEPSQCEVRIRRRDGSMRWLRIQSRPLPHPNRLPGWTRWLGAVQDITERKRIEEALRESEERYATATTAGRVSVWDVDIETGNVQTDDMLPLMLKVGARDSRTQDRWLEFIEPDERKRLECAVARALAADAPRDADGHTPFPEIEYRAPAPDGRRCWFLARGTVLRRADGAAYRMIGTLTDITQIKHAQIAQHQGEQRLQAIIDSSTAIIYVKDVAGRYQLLNRGFETLWGIDREQAMGRTDQELLDYPIAATFVANDRHIWQTGATLELEETLSVGDETRSYITTKFPLRDASGAISAVCGISTDITERVRAAESIRAANALLQSSIDALTAHVTILDNTGRIIAVNEAWRRFSIDQGFSGGECCGVGANYLDVCDAVAMNDVDAQRAAAGIRAVLRGESDDFRMVYPCHAPGTERWFQMRTTRFHISDQVFLVVAHEDVTDLKQAEESVLALASRLLQLQDDERRRIARELHDVTAQNLFAITMNLMRIRGQAGLDDRSAGLLEDSLALGEQSLREIRTLSYLLHPPLLDQTGIVAALEWYVDGFVARSGIDVNLAAVRDIGRLPADVETALFRVVQECLTNIHRHSGSGTATIRLTRGKWNVVLDVRDQGQGINPAMFISSSDDIRSLGVGIPGMRQRIYQLGGDFRIRSSRRGTAVIVTIPVATEQGDTT